MVLHNATRTAEAQYSIKITTSRKKSNDNVSDCFFMLMV